MRIALQPVGGGLFGDNRYGWIMGWYNLEDDPFKTRNLSALMFFPLIKPHHIGYMEKKNGQWTRIEYQQFRELNETLDVALGLQQGPYRNQHGTVSFEVLEESPVRVRTRTSHDRWPFESTEYTFYPTGQIFVAATFDLEHEDPSVRIGTVSFYTAKNARINQREAVDGDSRMSGEGGNSYRTRFVLAHSNAVPSFQSSMPDDILTCASVPGKRETFVNNEIPLSWRRAPLRFHCDQQADTAQFALQMRVYPRNIDSFEAGLPYVEDYQFPDTLSVSVGSRVTDEAGDLNGDGYNESEGCYVLKASGEKVKLTIDATDRPRFQPALKITGWSGGKPKSVTINGEPAKDGVDYNLTTLADEDRIVVQILGILDGSSVSVDIH